MQSTPFCFCSYFHFRFTYLSACLPEARLEVISHRVLRLADVLYTVQEYGQGSERLECTGWAGCYISSCLPRRCQICVPTRPDIVDVSIVCCVVFFLMYFVFLVSSYYLLSSVVAVSPWHLSSVFFALLTNGRYCMRLYALLLCCNRVSAHPLRVVASVCLLTENFTSRQ